MSDSSTKKSYSKYASIAFILGIVFVAISLVGLVNGVNAGEKRHVLSYLIGLGFWTSVTIGMLFMTLMFYIFKAKWPIIIRRQLEHGMAAFPYLFLLALPVIFVAKWSPDHAGIIWKWMDPAYKIPGGTTVGNDALFQAKSAYLDVNFFIVRNFIYFGIFAGLAFILRKCSFTMDQDGDAKWASIGIKVSAVGIFATALSTTFLAFDWFKSLEFHWFSTMYGVWFFAACMRAAISVTVIICFILATRGYLKGIFGRAHLYDLACMMLTFTIFWTYISFSQYFLIYTANIPEEAFWYVLREVNEDGTRNSWFWVSMGLIFLHFFAPFFMLLRYENKVRMRNALIIACWILTFHILDLYWNILPGKVKSADAELGYVVRQFDISIYDITSLIGIGAFFAFAFFRSMGKAEPIPVRDPRIIESVNHHE